MDFNPSACSAELQQRLQRFMADLVLPWLPDWHRWADAGVYPLEVTEPLKTQARALGLWSWCLWTRPACTSNATSR